MILDKQQNAHAKNLWRGLKKTINKRRMRFNTQNNGDDSDKITEDEEETKSVNDEIAELPVISNDEYYWQGKDYSNHYKTSIKNVPEFWSDQLDRTVTPRMPWRDQALVVIGESARDLARHFIQRWNQCKV